jgi:hypothetical protein
MSTLRQEFSNNSRALEWASAVENAAHTWDGIQALADVALTLKQDLEETLQDFEETLTCKKVCHAGDTGGTGESGTASATASAARTKRKIDHPSLFMPLNQAKPEMSIDETIRLLYCGNKDSGEVTPANSCGNICMRRITCRPVFDIDLDQPGVTFPMDASDTCVQPWVSLSDEQKTQEIDKLCFISRKWTELNTSDLWTAVSA